MAPKPHPSSPNAREALEELARCFARAAVDEIVAGLAAQQLPELRLSQVQTVAQDPGPPRPTLPETGFLRLRDIIGDRSRGMTGLIPVSVATWYSWIATQRAPKPVKLGRTSVWRVEDIRALVERLSAGISLKWA